MSWRDRYRPGSFRGVPFVTIEHSAELGRRGETHELPERDQPYREDLGRAARRWSVQAFVIGADYMTGRDRLLAAVEAFGPGTLVHPFLGTFQASVDTCRLTESTAEGGMARFDLQFVEPGSAIVADAAADTRAIAESVASGTDSAARARFAADFRAADQAPPVQTAAARLAARLAGTVAGAGQLLGGAGPVLRAFHDGIAALQGAAVLVTMPLRMADSVLAMVGALASLGASPADQARALLGITVSASAGSAVTPTTPSRAREAANAQALADLTIAAAGGALARVAAGATFTSYDAAIGFRDQIADSLDSEAIAAADRGNDALAADLDRLRRAVIADITARGGSLQRLFGYTPPVVTPALVIAWRLYRDPAATVDQAAELVERNGVRHPGFVPAAELQVLTAGGADAF